MMQQFHFHLTPEMHGALQKAAHEQGRTAAEICRRAVARALDEHRLERGADADAPAVGAGPANAMPLAPAAPTGGS
jgi:hypothetical protein